MAIWVNESPKYTTYPIPEFIGNPLIEALAPMPLDRDDGICQLSEQPTFDPMERDLPASMRMYLPARLSRFLFPTTQHVRFLNHLCVQVYDGYVFRNPLTPEGQYLLHNAGSPVERSVPVIDCGTGRLSTISMVCGLSGMGKSTLIRGCMRVLGKPVIRHSNYHGEPFPETQILYLMRNVPDQCTPKAFCKTYGDYTDALLGMPLYAKFFADKSMTRNHYLSQLQRIIASHHVGALILDCVENLLLAGPSGVKEFVAMLINMRDELKVPIILVGTYKAAEILKTDMSTARRLVEGGFHELKRPANECDIDFSALCEVLWEYQWVRRPIVFGDDSDPVKAKIKEVLFDCSQGITGILITLFIAAQIEAIDSGRETVDVNLIRSVYAERFKPLHRIINAIRSNKSGQLDQFDDLYLRAFSELKSDPLVSRIDEIRNQLAASQERNLGISPASEEPQTVTDVTSESGFPQTTEALLAAVRMGSSQVPTEIA